MHVSMFFFLFLRLESEAKLTISLSSLILSEKKMRAYYRYEGSRTIPSCSETVIWTVFEQRIPLSKIQVRQNFDAISFLKK